MSRIALLVLHAVYVVSHGANLVRTEDTNMMISVTGSVVEQMSRESADFSEEGSDIQGVPSSEGEISIIDLSGNWISNESSLADVHASLDIVQEYLKTAGFDGEVLQVDASKFQGKQRDSLIQEVQQALAAAPLGAVLVRNAFNPSGNISLATAKKLLQKSTAHFELNNGYYPVEAEETRIEKQCREETNQLFKSQGLNSQDSRNRRTAVTSRTMMQNYLNGNILTDMHMFASVPSGCHHECCGKLGVHFDVGSLPHALRQEFQQGMQYKGPAFAGFADALFTGRREIATVMRQGTSIQFHSHSPTWFALTHGQKAWWLGPPGLAKLLKQIGSGNARSCEYLREKPHPGVKAVVQGPGDILFFGERVSHATCALETSMGVGDQVGYFDKPFLNLTGDSHCKHQGASKCFF